MKKTIGLSLLTLLVAGLAAGMMSGAAFADPPFLNAHVWQNNNNHFGWNNNRWDYDRDHDRYDRDRFQDARRDAREHWQFERQRLAQERRFDHERYENRMQHLRTAEARFDRNHFWDRDHDGDRY